MSIKLPSDNKGKTKKKKSILTCNEKQKLWDMYDSDKICIEVMGFKLQALDIQEQFYQHFMIAIIVMPTMPSPAQLA